MLPNKIFVFDIFSIYIFTFHREPKNNIMSRRFVPTKQTVKRKSEQQCPFATIFGMRTGSVQSAVKEIDAIIILR